MGEHEVKAYYGEFKEDEGGGGGKRTELVVYGTSSLEFNNEDEENSGLSTPSRRFRMFGRGEGMPIITFMNVSEDGHYLALGFANGQDPSLLQQEHVGGQRTGTLHRYE